MPTCWKNLFFFSFGAFPSSPSPPKGRHRWKEGPFTVAETKRRNRTEEDRSFFEVSFSLLRPCCSHKASISHAVYHAYRRSSMYSKLRGLVNVTIFFFKLLTLHTLKTQKNRRWLQKLTVDCIAQGHCAHKKVGMNF